MNESEVLTTKEAAQLLRLTEDTVRRQAAGRQLPAYRLGRHWRLFRSELLKVVKGEWQSSNAHPMAPGGYGSELGAAIFFAARERKSVERRKSLNRPSETVTGDTPS